MWRARRGCCTSIGGGSVHVAEHEGVEVDTQGDAFFVASARASNAVAAAADCREAAAVATLEELGLTALQSV